MEKVIRYKVWKWVDLRDNTITFGVAAKIDKNWYPVRSGKNPLFFNDRDSAQQYVNELNREPVVQPQ